MSTDPTWIDVASFDDLWEDAGFAVDAAGRDVALFRIGEQVHATDNLCTHGHARLCDGFVEGGEVECPLHQGRFDLRTGAATCAPAVEPLQTYPVRIAAGRVLLRIA